MDFSQIMDIISNNGVGIACIVYFMFRDFKFMQNLTETVASLNSTLQELQTLTNTLRGGDGHGKEN